MKKSTTWMCALALCAGSVMTAKAETVVVEETPLTQEMFKSWDGVGADAQPTGATPYWDAIELGTEGTEAVVYGSANVTNTDYADLTGYTSLVIEGSEGLVLRVMFNRQLDNSLTEVRPTIGSDGKATVDLTAYEYVHLNAIKMNWGSTGTVTALTLVKEEEVPDAPVYLTDDMFHVWDGSGADAQPTSGTPYFESHFGEELSAGGTLYGNGNVYYLEYADLTGYTGLVVKGTAGVNLGFRFNRLEDNGTLTQLDCTIGEDGTVKLDLTGLEFAHLNAVKLGWGSPAGTVESIELVTEEPEVPEDGMDKLTQTMYHEWSSAFADATVTATSTYCEYNVGTEQDGGATIYGNGSVLALCYADVSEYAVLVIEGTPGLQLRVLMNRVSDNGDLVEVNPAIDESGVAYVNLTQYEFAHINAIKRPWDGSKGGTITALKLSKDVTVGIETIEAAAQNAEVIYDLQGRVVTTMGKGLFVKGGKVIMVK